MMYSEFIAMSELSENYITHNEYSTEIEPIYTDCELSKTDFISLMKESFEKIVYPAIEKAIHNLPLEEKALLAAGSRRIKDKIKPIDDAARKVAYNYMRLFTQI